MMHNNTTMADMAAIEAAMSAAYAGTARGLRNCRVFWLGFAGSFATRPVGSNFGLLGPLVLLGEMAGEQDRADAEDHEQQQGGDDGHVGVAARAWPWPQKDLHQHEQTDTKRGQPSAPVPGLKLVPREEPQREQRDHGAHEAAYEQRRQKVFGQDGPEERARMGAKMVDPVPREPGGNTDNDLRHRVEHYQMAFFVLGEVAAERNPADDAVQ